MKGYIVSFSKLFILSLLLILCGCLLKCAFATEHQQRMEIHSSPNPVGSGARALGMGGAFIAIADDATAASWNPGGLFRLKLPEVSVVYAGVHRIEDNSFGNLPDASGTQTISENAINYLSAAYPFNLWDRNMIVSINYQYLYDFSREWNFPVRWNSQGLTQDYAVDFQQDGSLSAIGIAYCIEITPQFSLGFTFNIWEDGLNRNQWEEKVREAGSATYGSNEINFESYRYDRYAFSGYNVNLGILWRSFRNRLSFGAVFKSPFKADLKHFHEYSYVSSAQAEGTPPDIGETHEKMEMPMSYGIGIAYRFSDEFSASIDIYRTEWDDFVRTDANGRETSPITGLPPGESDIDPTHQVRMGAEYLFIKPTCLISLCGGIFYDPAPARGNPDDFFGFSIGSGFGMKQWDFDIAYQYRFGNNVGSSVLEAWEFSQDVHEHTVYSSVIFHF